MEIAILTDEISLNLDEALREGKSLGFRKYELRCIDSYEKRIPAVDAAYIDMLAEKVSRREIEMTALTPGIFKLGLDNRERVRAELDDILPRTCEMAVRLGAPRVIVFGFLRGPGGNRREALDRLREAGRVAADFGLELSIENEPGCYCDTGVNTADMLGEIATDNVGVNWDPANAVIAGEAAYPIGYDAVRPFIQNVHVKDSIPLPDDKWENRLLGDGGMNWVGQLGALAKDASVSHITLETHVFPLLESTREDLRRLRLLLKTANALRQSDPA